jgi:hypothetical protein
MLVLYYKCRPVFNGVSEKMAEIVWGVDMPSATVITTKEAPAVLVKHLYIRHVNPLL